ncbi:MAG: glycosyltransferase [Dehalococcoidia bacterium]|nr:glycosyltransferase [Dehalococcoidia bacterium]
MEILIATDSFAPKIDGVADTAAVLAEGLSRRGHSVSVLAPGPGASLGTGYRVERMHSLPFPLYPEVRVGIPDPFRMSRLFRQPPGGAIVLTSGPVGVSTVAAMAGAVSLVNIYTTDMPGYVSTYLSPALAGAMTSLTRWMSRRSVATLCPTSHVQRALAASGHERLEVWGRGVDSHLFNPARRDERWRSLLTGGETTMPLALYVGRLAEEKRLLDLADAVRGSSGVRFALVGDGPQRKLLEREFTDSPVVFTGYLRGASLAAAYASADFFIFPSDSDTFGQVVIQAMASGLPVIVTSDSAPAELAPDGSTAIHVPARHPEAVTNAIQMLAGDAQRRRVMAANALARSRRHSWEALVTRIEDLIETRGR